MDIPNLSQNQTPLSTVSRSRRGVNPIPFIIIGGIAIGFAFSRIIPTGSTSTKTTASNNTSNEEIISSVDNKDEVKVGKLYGNANAQYKDSAIGVVKKGSINGEGTHILIREGGDSQRASLTSSAVDLDLFIDKKVEVKGETNASKKTSWLLDVGTIKVIE